MKSPFTPGLCAALALLIGPAAPAADQPKPARPVIKSDSAIGTADVDAMWKRRLPQLQLDNLPLSEVANYLSDQFPEINFLVDPSVRDIAVSIKLKSVTLDDIFTAIGVCTQNAVQINRLDDRMVSFTQRAQTADGSDKPVCRAFTLSRYLAGKTDKDMDAAMRDLEEALDRCWEMLKKADRSDAHAETPQLSLHRGTKLLIVVGRPDRVAVVEQVIQQLEEGAVAPAPAIDPATGLPLPTGYGAPGAAPGFPSTPKPPGAR